MPRNGSGTMNVYTPGSPVVAGTTISTTFENAKNADFASEITNSIAADGQTQPTANLPMATRKHTNVGNASARTEYAAAGQVQDGSFIWGGTAGGTGDAITLTLSPVVTAYAAGQTFRFIASAANTGAATLAVNGLSATAIQLLGNALTANTFTTGETYQVTYDGTAFQITSFPSALGAQTISTLTMTDDINEAKSSDVASAGTTDIWASTGNLVPITGTTTITSLGTAPQAGAERTLRFAGALTLTHGANLILPGAANITTAANDIAVVRAITTTQHQVILYQKAASKPYVLSTEFIQQNTPSAAGSTTFSGLSGYSYYVVEVIDLHPASAGTFDLQMTVSGVATNYNTFASEVKDTAAGSDYASSSGSVYALNDPAAGVSAQGGARWKGFIRVIAADGSIDFTGSYYDGTNFRGVKGNGDFGAGGNAVTSISLSFSGANTTGTVRLYGVV